MGGDAVDIWQHLASRKIMLLKSMKQAAVGYSITVSVSSWAQQLGSAGCPQCMSQTISSSCAAETPSICALPSIKRIRPYAFDEAGKLYRKRCLSSTHGSAKQRRALYKSSCKIVCKLYNDCCGDSGQLAPDLLGSESMSD